MSMKKVIYLTFVSHYSVVYLGNLTRFSDQLLMCKQMGRKIRSPRYFINFAHCIRSFQIFTVLKNWKKKVCFTWKDPIEFDVVQNHQDGDVIQPECAQKSVATECTKNIKYCSFLRCTPFLCEQGDRVDGRGFVSRARHEEQKNHESGVYLKPKNSCFCFVFVFWIF